MLLVRTTLPYPALLLSVVVAGCTTSPPLTSGPRISMEPGASFTMQTDRVDTVTATVIGGESDVAYSSSNAAVAAIDPVTGEIWARTAGVTTITATATAAPTTNASVQLTVVAVRPPEPIEVDDHAEVVGNLINEVCPNEQENVFADSIPIDTDLRVVHEFHDCQRLIRNNQYESLVGIFAHRNVTTYPVPIQYVGGRLAALILNFRTKTNWMPYAPLGLAPGTNCLVLKFTPNVVTPTKRQAPTRGAQRQAAQPGRLPARTDKRSVVSGTWQAAIVHRPSSTGSYGDCPNGMTWATVEATPATQKYMLTVKPQPDAWEPDGNGNISPPVARWDWDRVTGENYLGVRCGKHGWCEIGGSPNFTPFPALKAGGKNIYKGYYDQQYLAHPNGTKSNVWGTVRPGEDAIVRGRIQRKDGIWWDAARIELEGPVTGSAALMWYASKLSMPIVDDQVANVRRAQGAMTIHSPAADVGKNWLMKVNGNGAVAGGELIFRGHPSEKQDRFATVRWRWNEEDETVWSFCEEAGCCEMRAL
jgi:hypothetical protein